MTGAPDPAGRPAPRLSFVVPVKNEEEAIPLFVAAMTPVIAELGTLLGENSSFEIVFVDDGSTDGTLAVIAAAAIPLTAIRTVKLSRNFGKDAALTAGLAFARGDAAIPMDVDLQDPPDVLPPMVDAWLSGARVVNAVRADRTSDSFAKRTAASIFYRMINRLSAYPVPRNVGDYRLLDRAVLDHLNTVPERVRFMKGLFSWVGFDPVSVEYARPARSAGATKWKFWPLWNFALDGITGSTTLPLRIWSYFGFGIAAVAALYALFIVVKTLILGIDAPGYASLMVTVLVLGAMNLIAVGIIGEYVGRISVEVRGRPLFLIDEVRESGGAQESRTERGLGSAAAVAEPATKVGPAPHDT